MSIFVFDVRNPAEPVFASVIEFPEKGWQHFYCDVRVYGGYLIGAEYSRLHIYSLERPDRPKLVHTFRRTDDGAIWKGYQWTLGGFGRTSCSSRSSTAWTSSGYRQDRSIQRVK